MARSGKSKEKKNSNGANLGFEEKLWQAADKMRGHMDPGEYKHVALGLIFLKYISDAFEEHRAKLAKEKNSDPEDRDEYTAANVFWVPKDARWTRLQDNAKKPTIGKLIDDAMVAIEKENPSLRGVLPKIYARPDLDKQRLGELIDLIGTIGLGDKESRSKDILGRVYEYFLAKFASQEGKKGGEFYTPRSIVKLLVEMIAPYKGRVYDPCCGSAGMFVQSEEFIEAHGGSQDDIAIFGQESNPTTWRLAKMNLAIRGIEANLGGQNADSFHNDLHRDLKADFILANPPFNLSDWGGERLRDDIRWKFGIPPVGNANFAWLEHILHHLSINGCAGVVLSNSSLSAERIGDWKIRRTIIEADVIDSIVILPKNLFYSTQIPACLWFLHRNKSGNTKTRDRRNQILFIDARSFGAMVTKANRALSGSDISKLGEIYHSWKTKDARYENVPGLCKTVSIETVKKNGYNLSPNMYIDIAAELEIQPATDFKEKLGLFISAAESAIDEKLSSEKAIQKAFHNLAYSELAKCHFADIHIAHLTRLSSILFHEWFVKFNFPNGGQGYADSGGKFIKTSYSDIPRLPIGWQLQELSQVAQVVDCLHSIKPEILPISEYLFLEVNNIAENGLISLKDKYCISKENYKLWTKKIEVAEGDCILTNTGRVGAVAQIPKGMKCAIGRNMTAIRIKTDFLRPAYLINYLLSAYTTLETYRRTDIGTILDSLNVKGIKKFNMVIPPLELIRKYEEFARPMRRLLEIGHEGEK